MDQVIKIENLTKVIQPHFWSKRQTILRGLDLEVRLGEIFGFLGPNGAGKTTTIKALMGIIRPTSGQIRILGHDPGEISVKKRIGYLPETPYFYDYLTGREFLVLCGRLLDIGPGRIKERVAGLLALVKMEEAADKQLRKYSKGMLQRIGLAQALINEPDLVVLDEPLTGLDPLGRKEFKDIISMLKAQGTTVFFSSHILPDAESICDRVAIINRGKILKTGHLDDLLDARIESIELVCRNVPQPVLDDIRNGSSSAIDSGEEHIFNFSDLAAANRAAQKAVGAGGQLVSLSPLKENLEEYFAREVKNDA
jgi:ABC-2 type transport system ATP-binding protein